MSLSLAELQAQRDALVTARSKGIRRLQSGSKMIEYASLEEMSAAISALDGEIAAASGSAVSRVVLVQHNRT